MTYSADLRWRVVWALEIDGDSVPAIAERLFVNTRFCQRVLACFRVHNDVFKPNRRSAHDQPPIEQKRSAARRPLARATKPGILAVCA